MSETLGIHNNLLSEYGLFDPLWKIVLNYLELDIPNVRRNYAADCDKCLNPIIDAGPIRMDLASNKHYTGIYYICMNCFSENSQNLTCLNYLKESPNRVTGESVVNLHVNPCVWLAIIDFEWIDYIKIGCE